MEMQNVRLSNSMQYLYIDGDDIGLTIESSFMSNDEVRLAEINNHVKSCIKKITLYLKENGGSIIFSGADGIICKSDNVELQTLLDYIREVSSNITFSIGAGETLCNSYIALRYAKSNGKNIAVFYGETFEVID